MANEHYMELARQIAARCDGRRLDASESVFFARELEHVRAQAFMTEYPALEGRSLVEINREADPADVQFTYQVFSEVGSAEVASGLSTPGPRVDVQGAEFSSKFFSIKDAYGWNIQELRASIRANKRLPQRKAMAAREAIERKIDDLILTGETDLGILGLFNQTTGITHTIATGVAGLKTWADKTPDEILIDMNDMAAKSYLASNKIEQASRILMPLDSYNLISTVRLGDGSDTTILKHFLGTNPFVENVRTHNDLATAGASSTRRMVSYDPRSDRLETPISQEFEQLPPQFVNYEVLTNCHARCAGTVLYRPQSLTYGDGI